MFMFIILITFQIFFFSPFQRDSILELASYVIYIICRTRIIYLLIADMINTYIPITVSFLHFRHVEVYEKVLKEFFILARTRVAKLRQFVLQFAPALLYLDLFAVAHGDSKVNNILKLAM